MYNEMIYKNLPPLFTSINDFTGTCSFSSLLNQTLTNTIFTHTHDCCFDFHIHKL